MPKLTLKLGLLLYSIVLAIFTLLHVVFPTSSVPPDGFGFRLNRSFGQTLLNNRVLIASDFRLVPGESMTSLKRRILQTYKPNHHPYTVTLGHSSNVPEGWIYTELTNLTPKPKEVVLSFLPHRCGRATLFLLRQGGGMIHQPRLPLLDSVATLSQTTPLAKRFFLTYRYALPFTIPPNQTVGILLRTNSYVGFNEVDLNLSSRQTFSEQLLVNNMAELLVIFSCLIIGLVSLTVGLTTSSALMRTYGCMMLMITMQACGYYGYLSGLPYPDFLSFNSSNITPCWWLLFDATAHLFLYEVFKPAVRHLRWYKPAMWTLIGIMVTCVLLHLVPPHVYVYLNAPINRTLMVVTHIGVIWIAYFSWLTYRRTGSVYMGLFMLVFTGDLIVRQLVDLLMNQNFSLLKYPSPAQYPLLLIGLLTYLIVMQFRRELVSRRQMQQQVYQAQEAVNTLRRQEVERIGRDLHDQVGNTLAAALGYLSRPEANADADKSRQLIRTAISEMRLLSHNLIKDNNRLLTEKVQTLVGRFNDFSDIQFLFKDHSDSRADQLPPIQQQSIYHIVQELFTNIVRHSGASRVYVQFFADDQTLEVSVEDNGTGFDLATAREKGVGLQNMFKRAELAQIILQFDPAPTGTSVHLTLYHDEALPNHSGRRPSAV